MKCNVCDTEIEYCDHCATNFFKGDKILCGKIIGNEHLCSDCSYEEGEVI